MRFVALKHSRPAIVAARIILVLLALLFFVDAIQSALVISRYDVPFGTGLWHSAAGEFLVAAIGGVSALALARDRRWAVWVWAVAVAAVALAGLAVGLNRSFLLRWEVALPWALLVGCGVLGLKQTRPWDPAA